MVYSSEILDDIRLGTILYYPLWTGDTAFKSGAEAGYTHSMNSQQVKTTNNACAQFTPSYSVKVHRLWDGATHS